MIMSGTCSVSGAREACLGSRVLCVGAGGIGCELLKTLVLSGFVNITVIDMDTIEVSNLNRQFLFRRRHVGQSKAKVAREASLRINPKAKIVAHHANVKEDQFDVDFFKSFDCVLNGLDNLEARRHVNRMALAASVPLVESGTAGYRGQVTVHIKGETECFECQPKPIPKKYPVCTIRNTPDKPIHCIVWAKDLLFPRLFGGEAVGAEAEREDEGKNGGEDEGKDRSDIEVSERAEGQPAVEYGCVVLREVYGDAIARLAAVEDMWKDREPPTPLSSDVIAAGRAIIQGRARGGDDKVPTSASLALGLSDSHATWSAEQSAAVFLMAVEILLDGHADRVGKLGFDKEFPLSVDFVTAASNLRSHCYGIEPKSSFDVKGMAGNIIHAIATTNAIISGLIVLEAQKLLLRGLRQDDDGATLTPWTTFVQHNPTGGRLLQRIKPLPPNPKCYVCSKAQVVMEADTGLMTLGRLVDDVLRKALAFAEPTVTVGSTMHYECGDDLEEDERERYDALRKRRLGDLPGDPIGHGSLVQVEDFSQEMSVELLVCHREPREGEDPDFFEVKGEVKGQDGGRGGEDEPEGEGDSDSDDLCVVEEAVGEKRKGAGQEEPAKRQRAS